MNYSKCGLILAQNETLVKQVCDYFDWDNVINYDEFVERLYANERPVSRQDREELIRRGVYDLMANNQQGVVLYTVVSPLEWEMLTVPKSGFGRYLSLRHEPMPESLVFLMGSAGIFGTYENHLLRHTNRDCGPFYEFWKDTMDRRVYKLFKGK